METKFPGCTFENFPVVLVEVVLHVLLSEFRKFVACMFAQGCEGFR